jgi:Thiolase-like protein type 1 additional C-terminal domain
VPIRAGFGVADLTTIDLYSCFPAPVFNICDGLGLAADDPRGLTVTGGLPFFGGPGNNYAMHAIAETVQRARRAPGSAGFVGANGGIMTKYSAGIYSTTPASWAPDRSAARQAGIDSWATPAQARQADGRAVIETCTVRHHRSGTRTGMVVGRLDVGGAVSWRAAPRVTPASPTCSARRPSPWGSGSSSGPSTMATGSLRRPASWPSCPPWHRRPRSAGLFQLGHGPGGLSPGPPAHPPEQRADDYEDQHRG